MAVLTRFRDLLWNAALKVTWLQGTWASRWRGLFAFLADWDAQTSMMALRSSWLHHGDNPDDALPYIGEERGMPQYPAESADVHRERLHGAWDAYGWAGAEQAIITQLIAFGFTPTYSTVPDLNAWTRFGLSQVNPVDGPSDNVRAWKIYEDSSTGYHELYAGIADLPTNKYLEIRFLARCDSDRSWLKIQVGTSCVFVNIASRATGATAAPGGQATVRGWTVPGWVVVRAKFYTDTASQTVRIFLAIGDETASYAGDTSKSVTIADVTIGTPEPMILRDNEVEYPDVPDWWSQFWVVVCEGSHSYSGSIPSADQAAIASLIRKWKPTDWRCSKAVFIESGAISWLQSMMTTAQWAALLNPGDNVTIEVPVSQ